MNLVAILILHQGKPFFCSKSVHPMVLLALLQRLIETITKGQVCLGLGTLNEALDLPGASALWLLLLLLLSILRLLLVLFWWLLVLFSRLGAAPTSHHASDGAPGNMANSTSNCNSACSGRHLFHQTGLLGLAHGRWRSGHGC